MTTPTHPTLGQRLTGLLATVAVLGIVLGLPALFLAIGASPIPDHVPPSTASRTRSWRPTTAPSSSACSR